MSFGFDPSIILSAKSPQSGNILDSLQSLSQLASQGVQREHAQASLADLLHQRQQQDSLASIYKANADTPDALPVALRRGGFGTQADSAQDQASQMQTAEATRTKLASDAQEKIRAVQDAHRKRVGEVFSNAKDQPSWEAAVQELASEKDPMLAIYAGHMPAQFDPAIAKRLGNLAMSAKDRAELEDKAAGRTQADKRIDIEDRRATAAERRASAVEARLGRDSGMGGGLPGGITEQALEKQVDTYEHTGVFPTLGQGKAGAALRVAIMNRHAEKYPDSDLAGAKAGYTADAASLRNQQKLADMVDSFEKTAGKNLDTFLETANKIADSGSPLFNAPGRRFQTLVAGDPKMAAFEAARQTAVTEIAKVLQGGSGGAALTEGAREEVRHLISPDASLAQIKAAAEILKRDMANRKAAVGETLKETRARMSGKGAKESGAKATGKLSQAEADELAQLKKELGQ